MNKYLLLLSSFAILLILGMVSMFNHTLKSDDSITGRDVLATVNILPATPNPCNFTISQGWNMVSFFCLGAWVPRNEVLLSINDSYESVFYYKTTDSADPWKSYNPDLPTWAVQQIDYMDRNTGYWIYLSSQDNYFYNGSKKAGMITLYPGWNLVGYPSVNSSSINDSLSGLLYTSVMTYDSINDVMLEYIPAGSSNTLTEFDTYGAYWINSSASQTWNVGP
ncbi:MAG: hypothetical protein ACP5NV_03780 [Candidatus Woesearchaeota archaeon]